MDKVQKWRINTKQRMVDSMGGECQICGYKKCNNALEFHHINPFTKEFALNSALERPKAWAKIVIELRKCVLLCSNCHRELHSNIANIEENKQYFDEEYSTYSRKQIPIIDECPICGNEKPICQTTCSSKCSGKLSGKVDWDNIDIDKLLLKHCNAEQVGKFLNVSGAAVRKRIKKLEKEKSINT